MKDVIALIQPVVNEVCREVFELGAVALVEEEGQLKGMPWLSIRARRARRLDLQRWWGAVPKLGAGSTPVLLYKQGSSPWRAMLEVPLDAGRYVVDAVADVSIDDFLYWFKEKLEYEIDRALFVSAERAEQSQQDDFYKSMKRIMRHED